MIGKTRFNPRKTLIGCLKTTGCCKLRSTLALTLFPQDNSFIVVTDLFYAVSAHTQSLIYKPYIVVFPHLHIPAIKQNDKNGQGV